MWGEVLLFILTIETKMGIRQRILELRFTDLAAVLWDEELCPKTIHAKWHKMLDMPLLKFKWGNVWD